MIALETFSTAGLDPRRKLEYWNETACASFTPVVSDPFEVRSFCGRLTRARLGELRLGEVYSDGQIVRHLRSHVARTQTATFFLQMQLEGESINRQDGREARIGPGDFTLCDTSRPYEMRFERANRMFVLGMPEALLRRHLAHPENLVAIPMPGGSGLSGMLSRFLRDFWSRCHEELEPCAAERVTRVILDLMANAYGALPRSQLDRSSLATAHRVRIINFIEEHLGDPDLTPTGIARACKMTSRYLHYLFEEESETVARYILRRRLEECARALRLPALRGRSLTSIAFDHGFNSSTHFGRVFRERYGISPREYRRHDPERALRAAAG